MLDKILQRMATRSQLPSSDTALPDRQDRIWPEVPHAVLGTPLLPPFPDRMAMAQFGLGCFWGAERIFWQCEGVYTTAVGYSGGYTQHPSYEDVCSGKTGHNEVIYVVFDPKIVAYQTLLKMFWQAHDPTQGMRQGNDVGTQYRSGIYTYGDEQQETAESSRKHYAQRLSKHGYSDITTEIRPASAFYYAEEYHQQYLAKNPNGYCGLGGTGLTYDE